MIKKLNKYYIDEIIEIHQKSIFLLWNKLGRKYTIKGVKRFIEEVFTKGKVFGYFLDKKLVGCIGLELEKDFGEISFLLVIKDYQGKNIGKRLMHYAETYFLDKTNKILLDVLKENPAIQFYGKLNYKIIGERGEKYIMEKKLR